MYCYHQELRQISVYIGISILHSTAPVGTVFFYRSETIVLKRRTKHREWDKASTAKQDKKKTGTKKQKTKPKQREEAAQKREAHSRFTAATKFNIIIEY